MCVYVLCVCACDTFLIIHLLVVVEGPWRHRSQEWNYMWRDKNKNSIQSDLIRLIKT